MSNQNDTLIEASDVTMAESDKPVKLYGGKGDDRLLGGDADDTIEGGEGDDVLIGGQKFFGDDVLKSEAAARTLINNRTPRGR